MLEDLRELIGGRAIVIVSGYRCVRHNAAVGGARRSRHVYGDAVDVQLGLITITHARAAGARGIGTQGNYVRHLDMRPTPSTWSY